MMRVEGNIFIFKHAPAGRATFTWAKT